MATLSVIRGCGHIVKGRFADLRDTDFVTTISPIVDSVPNPDEVTINAAVTPMDALISEFVSGTMTVTTSDPGDTPAVDNSITGAPGSAVFAPPVIQKTALNAVGNWTVAFTLSVILIGQTAPVTYSFTKTIATPFA